MAEKMAKYCKHCGYIFTEVFLEDTMEDKMASSKMRSENYVREKYIKKKMEWISNYHQKRGEWCEIDLWPEGFV